MPGHHVRGRAWLAKLHREEGSGASLDRIGQVFDLLRLDLISA